MKILFVGDCSNLHNCLAQQLRKMGHDAVVASHGSFWMNTGRDIDLARGDGRLGTVAFLWKLLKALPRMRGYDIVQLASPGFVELRPEKIRLIFDYLRKYNRKVVLSALKTDVVYHQACHDGHTYRYSDYMVGDLPSPYALSAEYRANHEDNWTLPIMLEHSDYVMNRVDGVISCLWEYHEAYRQRVAPERLAYGGIPIDTDSLTLRPLSEEPRRVRLFIGIQRDRTVVKGTDRLLEAARRCCDRHPRECELEVVENVPYSEYTQRMRASHVILDQLYSYTPATNAMIAMAQGLVAVSGAEPEFYEFIGETQNHPIVNVNPCVEGDIDEKLEYIIAHKHRLPQWSRESREFVLKHNSAQVVARRSLDFWQRMLG